MTWEHLKEKAFVDENGVLHQKCMCQRCGFIHEFLDGHTSQYNYCPQCGEFLQPQTITAYINDGRKFQIIV